MADLHKLFQTFHTDVQILASKKTKLSESKDTLRKKIRKYFKENHEDLKPEFYIQGSYKMGSAIRTKDDTCDLDDGVYFRPKPDVTGTTLQGYIYDAVEGHTDEQQHRKKCISVIYKEKGKESYNIDLPVYYHDEKDGIPYLAIKNEDYQESDPKEMSKWFKSQKKKKADIVKMVRYLKAWCDHVRDRMPNGLAMTILASKAIDKISWIDKRDDVTLKNMLKEIRKVLKVKFECIVPAVPSDDLFENYDQNHIDNFFTRIDAFIEDAEKALEEKNEKKASLLWKKHLGRWFPEGEDKDEEITESTLAGLSHIVSNNKPYRY
jgi:hypothetical protein